MNSLTKKAQVQKVFNYRVLETEKCTIVKRRTEEIKQRLIRAAQDIWEIGQKLVEVRLWLKHGQFEVWLKAEFGWSHRTAYNFINVYEAFHKTANFAEIDMAASALYLLAAPSTSQDIRDKFLNQAREGERITYKQVRQTIKEEKSQLIYPSIIVDVSEPPKCEIVTLIPKAKVADKVRVADDGQPELQISSNSIANLSIQPGWYLLENQHLLFCGDTASPHFIERIPQAAFALAITSDDWDHDWLIERARTVLVLQELIGEEKLIEQLILMFSNRGEAVVFPWLPTGELIAVANRLERQVYAGDPDIERCVEVISRSGLAYERIKP